MATVGVHETPVGHNLNLKTQTLTEVLTRLSPAPVRASPHAQAARSPVIKDDDYIFEKTLGEGSYGKVKLARHRISGEKVAVKIIDKTSLSDPDDAERVMREILVMKSLRHPYIAELFEVIDRPSEIRMVMQYCPGGELFDYIVAHQRIQEKEARRIFRQIFAAIDYCHRNNIIHRDLKTENLLFDEGKNIKIIDFGFTNTYKHDAFLD
eukprot:Opistho-2@83577